MLHTLYLWLYCLFFLFQTHSIDTKEKIILIAIGSFNPPTLMHLRMFETARHYFREFDQTEVIAGIISPRHELYPKSVKLVANNYRRDMINLSTASSDWIRSSDWQLTQPNWTMAAAVLEYHQNYIDSILSGENLMIPNWLPPNFCKLRGQQVRLKPLCGADKLDTPMQSGTWQYKDVQNLIANYGLVVVTRNNINARKSIFDSDLLHKFRKNITIVDDWLNDGISSTAIRNCLRSSRPIKYLVDDDVIRYIHEHNLYD